MSKSEVKVRAYLTSISSAMTAHIESKNCLVKNQSHRQKTFVLDDFTNYILMFGF